MEYQHLIAAIAEETGVDVSRLNINTDLLDVPGFDEVTHNRILINFEQRLGSSLPFEKLKSVHTIRDILAGLE